MKKGLSLIALIITIVVMIILAAIVISGGNGLLEEQTKLTVIIYDKEEKLVISAVRCNYGGNYLMVYGEDGTRYMTNQDYLIIERTH